MEVSIQFLDNFYSSRELNLVDYDAYDSDGVDADEWMMLSYAAVAAG
jgi:hypothetical protein